MRIYKKYRENNQVTLHNGDCVEFLQKLPNESVDLVITSPPYCIGKAYEDPHDDIQTFRNQHIIPVIHRRKSQSESATISSDNLQSIDCI